MALAIGYEEEMVGSGHPTKADTLNRLFLGGPAPALRDTDGKVLAAFYKERTGPPAAGSGELALYAREADGVLRLFCRDSAGQEAELA
jgi:hypothetical protein